jgi:endonuclease YncB( thermonuclease family)
VVDASLRGYLEASRRHVTIKRVLDGDTIAVNPGDERIRLLTIDAAERHVATHGPAACGADEAWHRCRTCCRSALRSSSPG